MTVPSESSPLPTRALLQDLVARGRTARVSVGRGAGALSAWVLDGHVVAARAGDDVPVLLQRLVERDALPAARANELRADMATMMDEDVLDPVLGQLLELVDDEALDEVLDERFREILASMAGHPEDPTTHDHALPWVFDIRIGEGTPSVLARAVRDWEQAAALQDDRQLVPGPVAGADALARRILRVLGEGPLAAGALAARSKAPPVLARAAVARMIAEGVLADDAAALDAGPGSWIDPGTVPGMLADDPPTEAGPPTDVSPDDDVMEAFSGEADRTRGAGGRGVFTTDAHNLDRVELDEGEPSSPSYAAPTLSNDDARDKIGVANDVLGKLSAAFDADHGPDAGRRTMQLLVDGRPRPWIPLFTGIRVTSAGLLPVQALLVNLRKRPDTEQRLLLNQGLLDLLDRALDRAAEELDEDRFDDLLGDVMGYRQAMGL